MTKKQRKIQNKKMYQDYLAKKNDDGYRYPNCPACWQNNKTVSHCIYGDDHCWTCEVCNQKWTVVA